MSQISFRLRPLPPFRLDLTVWVLRRRMENTWDYWDGKTYRRVLVLQEKPLEVAVIQTGPLDAPELKITAESPRLKPVEQSPNEPERLANRHRRTGSRLREVEEPLTVILERMLGLQTDLSGFYQLAMKDRKLKPLATKFRGMKPPRYPSVFEALVNAITCQQFTLTAGIRLLSRLVKNWGMARQSQPNTLQAFPRPQDLALLEMEDLRKLGFSRQKARSLIEISGMVVKEGLDLERLASVDDQAALESLTRLRGVGRWTAEYVLLRGLGRIHIFPGDDVGVRNRLQSWMGVTRPLDYEGVGRILNRWEPFGGLVYFLLLLNGLDEQGLIERQGEGNPIPTLSLPLKGREPFKIKGGVSGELD